MQGFIQCKSEREREPQKRIQNNPKHPTHPHHNTHLERAVAVRVRALEQLRGLGAGDVIPEAREAGGELRRRDAARPVGVELFEESRQRAHERGALARALRGRVAKGAARAEEAARRARGRRVGLVERGAPGRRRAGAPRGELVRDQAEAELLEAAVCGEALIWWWWGWVGWG